LLLHEVVDGGPGMKQWQQFINCMAYEAYSIVPLAVGGTIATELQ
jgi:hypothetical protein